QSYWPLRLATATIRRVPVVHDAAIAKIVGRERVEAVELTNGRTIECDTVVFTGAWMPDNELVRRGAIELDAAHRGPCVDEHNRRDGPGVFAVGNLVPPAETADVCALGARHAVPSIVSWLSTGAWPRAIRRIRIASPISWISPSIISDERPAARNRLFL